MTDYIAIGDIHGTSDLLEMLLEQLPGEGTLVFLGDYIDRGPNARGVVERLMKLREERECVFLRGNHEDMALLALEVGGHHAEEHWFINGGMKTLESYNWHIPPDHVAFIKETRYYFETDDFIFVHGGLVPGQQPADTDPEELIWMREPFLSSSYDWGKLVIHGHTPTRNGLPEVRRNRINIDTAAVYGGRLTALLLPEREVLFAAHEQEEEQLPDNDEIPSLGDD